MMLIVMGCNNQSPEGLWQQAKIMRSENNLKESLINLESILEKYPKHDLAAEAQFQKAEIYLNDIKDYNFAIEEYEKAIDQYPNNDVAKKSLFMLAYIYNNYLTSYTDAIINYKLFMVKYPNDELIQSVEYELKGLAGIESVIDSLNLIVSNNKRNNIQ